MQALWLRYLTEIDEKTVEVPEELLANPEVKKAVKAVEESAFTPAQLLGYEKFWDIISVEKTLYYSAEQKGRKEEREEIARSLKNMNLPVEQIMQATGLTAEEIKQL
jgi:hypothetical protein bfra3_22303